MLLDEDPAALIAQCTKNFKTSPDHSSLLRIRDSLSSISQIRTSHLSDLSSTLQKLARQHQTLASTHNITVSQHNPTSHAAEILRLDTEKFKIAKQASDLEIEGERLQSELSRLGNVLAELEVEGVEGVERERGAEEDATVYVVPIFTFPPIYYMKPLYGETEELILIASPTDSS